MSSITKCGYCGWVLKMDVLYQHSYFANYDGACHVLSVDEAGKILMINKNITETLNCESLTEDVTENQNNVLETQDIDEELIRRDTTRVTNLSSPSCLSTNDGNDDYTDLENRPPSSVSELSATTSSSRKRRLSNNTDEVDRALLEALNTNIQPSPIDGFMLRLAEGMRRLPYRERSKLELEFLMKLELWLQRYKKSL